MIAFTQRDNLRAEFMRKIPIDPSLSDLKWKFFISKRVINLEILFVRCTFLFSAGVAFGLRFDNYPGLFGFYLHFAR